MTEAELYELLLISAEQIDASFEFWLTVSFAVLAAIYVTRGALDARLKILLCGLYVSASLISVLLTIGDVSQIAAFAEQLEGELPGRAFSATGDLVRYIVYFVGTVSISVAIFRLEKWMDDRRT
jgi:hypothetical protein